MEFQTNRLTTYLSDENFVNRIERCNQDAPGYVDSVQRLSEAVIEHPEITPADMELLIKLIYRWKDPNPESLEVVRRKDDKAIGYFQLLHTDTDTPYIGIELLYEFRHRGYGTELLQEVTKALRVNGRYKELRYVVSPQNGPSVHLIEKCGGILLQPEFPHQHFFYREYKITLDDGL